MINLGIIDSQDFSPFSPLDVANLVAWRDASDLSTISEDDNAGFVSTLQDKSGNGNDLAQPSAPVQPTTGVETIGLLNAFGFDGIPFNGKELETPTFALSPNLTLFMAVNVISVGDILDSIVALGIDINANFEINAGNATQFLAKLQSEILGATNPPESPVDLVGQDVLIVYRFSAVDGTVTLRKNGVTIAVDTYNGALSSVVPYFVGGNRFGNKFVHMKFGEDFIYSRDLGLNEIVALENITMPKWGI